MKIFKKKTVASIVKPLTKTITQLENVSYEQRVRAGVLKMDAEELMEESDLSLKESKKADALARKLSELIS